MRGRVVLLGSIVSAVSLFIVAAISTLGYGALVAAMTAESACIPLPSEVTMPFAGYLVATGRFNLQLVALAGTLGCLLGSYIAYFVGASGGRWVLERWGRYVLISPRELEAADRFFERWGSPAIFISRLLPVVRTFIALPAGVARMRLLPFTVYTVAGSYIWCLALAFAGMKLGQHWNTLGPWFHRFDGVIGILIIAAAALIIYGRVRGIAAAGRTAPSAGPER